MHSRCTLPPVPIQHAVDNTALKHTRTKAIDYGGWNRRSGRGRSLAPTTIPGTVRSPDAGSESIRQGKAACSDDPSISKKSRAPRRTPRHRARSHFPGIRASSALHSCAGSSRRRRKPTSIGEFVSIPCGGRQEARAGVIQIMNESGIERFAPGEIGPGHSAGGGTERS